MTRNRFLTVFLTAAALVAGSFAPTTVRALGRSASLDQTAVSPVTAKLTVVISRFEGEKQTGSLPFVLMIVPGIGDRDGDTTSLQMGSDIAVPARTTEGTSYQYRPLGTNISAGGRMLEDGRFSVMVNVQDSQIMSDPTPGTGGMPRFQNFRSNNRLILRDAQALEYTAAVDKASGEVVKVAVRLEVIK